jgi:DNA segregation ATPase FtsK/SpoIIIE, S-DNA-T family
MPLAIFIPKNRSKWLPLCLSYGLRLFFDNFGHNHHITRSSAGYLNFAPDRPCHMAKRTLFNYKSDDRIPKLIGIFLIFMAIYCAIALLSYLFTWREDQDEVLQWSWDLIFLSDIEVSNFLGRLGAIVSNGLVYWTFGLPVVLVVPLLFKYGLAYVRGTSTRVLTTTAMNYTVAMVIGSILLEFVFGSQEFPWGGVFGQSITDWMIQFLGVLGTIVFVVFALALAFFWSFNPATDQMTPQGVWSILRSWGLGWFDERYRRTAPTARKPRTLRSALKGKAGLDGEAINEAFDEIDASLAPTKSLNMNSGQGALADEITGAPIPVLGDEIAFDHQAGSTSRTPVIPNKELEIEMAPPVIKTEDDEPAPRPTAQRQSGLFDETEPGFNPSGEPYDPTLDLSHYEYPVTSLLNAYDDQKVEVDRAELEANKDQIIATLLNYKIEITKIRATVGPTVTLYEIVPAPGVRISRIKNLEDDIALSLAALGIRIIAPIPGRGTIGIEVPNKNKQVVPLKECLLSDKFKRSDMELPIALGKTISNEVFVADLTKMPHLLIAGATGQGKSVGINTILMSLLFKKHPSQVKLVLIDPKKVELSPYSKIENHFLAYLPNQLEPIITDTAQVINTMHSLVIEMEDRYTLLKKANARNISEYNVKFVGRRLNPEKGHHYLPFIVLVIDEFADLIMTAGKEVEMPIARLAQLSRAVGIHLIIATQRPSVNIITGVIKANFPVRVAFKVASKVDSRTILDAGGADQLIGRGDMLISLGSDVVRLQCAFVDTPEVERVIDFIAQQQGYATPFFLPEYRGADENDGGPGSFSPEDLDDLFEDAARLIIQNQTGSTSMIQRRMKIGFNRAGRLMDQLEAMGIVGPPDGPKPREVHYFDEGELEKFLATLKNRR